MRVISAVIYTLQKNASQTNASQMLKNQCSAHEKQEESCFELLLKSLKQLQYLQNQGTVTVLFFFLSLRLT